MSKLTEVLSLQAENELEDALYFYDLISTKIGDNFLNQINTCIESILLNPETYKLEFDVYRQAVVKKFPFVIIYTKIDSKILISAIFHTSKNPNKKFKFSHNTNKKPQLL
jgi:plasmid stabilization system protein ParE